MSLPADGAGIGRLVPLLLASTTMAATGCGGPPASGPLDIDALPTLSVESDRRIGSLDDPDVGFSRIRAVAVDRDGLVYVLESSVQEIRVYDREGRVLRRIGREGEGPGEFQSASAFGIEGDTVWVIDGRADRITLFDRSGDLLSARRFEPVTVPTPSGFGSVRPVAMRPDGLFTSALNRVSYRRDLASEVEPGDGMPVPRVLFDATGAVVDTVGWDPHPPPRMVPPPDAPTVDYRSITVGGEHYVVPTSGSVLPIWHPLHDGRIVVDVPRPSSGDEETFRVTRFGLSGDTLYARVFHYRPEPYTGTDLDSIAAERAREGSGVFIDGTPVVPDQDPGQLRAATARIREAMDFPDYRQPIGYPWVAQDESVWLPRAQPEGAPRAARKARWIVLGADGMPRGEIGLPAGARILWARGDVFWAVEQDHLDVPWLVRYRIVDG